MGEPVIPEVKSPEGVLKRLPRGIVLGGKPVLPEQYRVTDPSASVETVARNLKIPWAIEFGPNGKLFFTERPGNVKTLNLSTGKTKKIFDLSRTLHWGEGGLMGLELHPDYPEPPVIFLSQTYGTTRDPSNRIIRVRLGDTLQIQPLIESIPAASYHNGSRLEIGPDGYLYATTGDAGQPRRAQDRSSWAGKILRMTLTGKPAPGNPFNGPVGKYVYSLGHRNPQGLGWHPETGELYASEHGPSGEFGLSGNDEINRIEKGGNYGWPEAVGAPGSSRYKDPLILFDDPHAPPAGLAFYSGSNPDWQGNFFVGSLAGEVLIQAGLNDQGEVNSIKRLFEESFYSGKYGRLRAVASGPDGAIYFSTSNRDGRGDPAIDDDRILKIKPGF